MKPATPATKTLGNTKAKVSDPQARNWCFTVNNPSKEYAATLQKVLATAKCKRFVFQEEKGESGTHHLQGYISMKSPNRFSTMQKNVPGGHLEIAKGSYMDNYKYCTKPEGRVSPPVSKGFPEPIRLIQELRPWQKEVTALLDKPADDRTIHWIWDSKGNMGKTQLAKKIVCERNALYLTGKAADMKYAVVEHFKQDACNKDNLIILIDLVRSQEGFVSYEGIESLKNGVFFSGKYESSMVVYNSPHIIVFANFAPELDKLSKDRWCVRRLDDASTP